MKKGVGSNVFRIVHHYDWNDTLMLKGNVFFRDKDRGLGLKFKKLFFNRKIGVTGSAGVNSQGLEAPALGIFANHLEPYHLSFHGNLGSGVCMKVSKEVDGEKQLGYSMDVDFSRSQAIGLNPSINYRPT